jgi:dihydrodipicolinate synthase/N-acetylneuraminate lyase
MKNTKYDLKGVIPAVISPMNEAGDLDMQALETQLEYLCGSGVHGFFIGGTTAEGGYLTSAEKIKALELTRQISDGRQYLCAACIQPSTRSVLVELDEVMKHGPDFIVAVAPYYYGSDTQGIVDHYTKIADTSSVPVILYDIPQHTHNPISIEAIQELSGHSNIVGLKDSTGNFSRFCRMLSASPIGDLALIQGDDYLDAFSLIYGADAIVTGLSNIIAEPYVRMYNAAISGDRDTVLKEQRLIHDLAEIIFISGGSPIVAIKAALEHLGRCERWMRVRGLSPSDDTVSGVGRIIDRVLNS